MISGGGRSSCTVDGVRKLSAPDRQAAGESASTPITGHGGTPAPDTAGAQIKQWSAGAISAAVRAIEGAADLHAVVTPCPERALQQARRATAGPVCGVPLLVKDMFDTRGLRTT